jgi:general secretion pathway protein I
MTARRALGFTLLETMVALAILALSLVAIFNLNSGAISMHAYSKKLTVASLLARSKMTDLEQELYDKGFSNDDDEKSGDFSDEGWSSFKWRAKIIAPRTQGVSPDQILGAIFNLPIGSGSSQDPMGALGKLFGGSSTAAGASITPPGSGSLPPGAQPQSGLGAMGGLLQTQFTQMVDQITKAVREVNLTVTWKDGKQVESMDVVTHVLSFGPGGDRNGNLQAAAAQASANNTWVNPRTGVPVPNPMQGPNGQMLDPVTREPLIRQTDFQGRMGALGGGLLPGMLNPSAPQPTPPTSRQLR